MHEFHNRTATFYIYSLKTLRKKPTPRAYRTAPDIIMNPSYGSPELALDRPHRKNPPGNSYSRGFLDTPDHGFFLRGSIACSDKSRQVSPALLYHCLTGQAQLSTDDSTDDTSSSSRVYISRDAQHPSALQYYPSPDDLLWKPYLIALNPDYAIFHFMALDENGQLLTATITFPSLAFGLIFTITHPKTAEHEHYHCYSLPVGFPLDTPSYDAPFTVFYDYFHAPADSPPQTTGSNTPTNTPPQPDDSDIPTESPPSSGDPSIIASTPPQPDYPSFSHNTIVYKAYPHRNNPRS